MDHNCGLIQPFTSYLRQLLDVISQVHPEKFWEVVRIDGMLYQGSQLSGHHVLVARAPEEGRVHESSHDTDSWRR